MCFSVCYIGNNAVNNNANRNQISIVSHLFYTQYGKFDLGLNKAISEFENMKIKYTFNQHIIYYEFMNVSSEKININIQQYEICYRFFDINIPDIDDKFEWKTLLFPSRTISNNKMVAINPINIQIERIKDANDIRYITSDNDTLFFIKLRVKHNPYYLLIENNKQTPTNQTQKAYRRKSYASIQCSGKGFGFSMSSKTKYRHGIYSIYLLHYCRYKNNCFW